MFSVLARAKLALRAGLLDPNDLNGWKSVDVNYHPPRVERLWRPFEDQYRLFLHCIHPCTVEEALLHPHLWASAMEVLYTDGVYRMLIGSAAGVEPPPVVTEIRFDSGQGGGFTYAMTHPDGWHAVVPEGGMVYTIMVTDLPWERQIPAVTEGVHGSLPGLSATRERELARIFYDLIR
jgi:hypothetical protein